MHDDTKKPKQISLLASKLLDDLLLALADRLGVKDLAQGYVSSSNYGDRVLVFESVRLKLITLTSQSFNRSQ